MPLIRRILDALLSGPEPFGTAGAVGADGYDVVILPEGVEPDFGDPTAFGVVESGNAGFTPGADGTRYAAWIRTRKGLLAGDPVVARIPLIASGGKLVARPNTPRITRTENLPGGDVAVYWEYDQADEATPLARFELYSDDGAGADFNFARTIATADELARRAVIDKSVLDSAGIPWANNTGYRINLQAVGENGQRDGNRAARLVVVRANPPAGLAASATLLTQLPA